MSLAQRLLSRIAILSAGALWFTLAPTNASADGLGGLEGARWLFLAVLGIAAFGLVVIVPALLAILRRHRRTESRSGARGAARILAVAYLVLTLPVALNALTARSNFMMLALLIVYLGVLALTLLSFFYRPRLVVGGITAALALVVLFKAQVVSLVQYEIDDNLPLPDPILSLEQKDSHFLPLADGRLFRFESESEYLVKDAKYDPGTPFSLEPVDEREGSLFRITGLVASQEYHLYQMSGLDPVLVIPVQQVVIPRYQAQPLGTVRLVADNWRAGNDILFRAIRDFCCDASWVSELIDRGADAGFVYEPTGANLLHFLADHPPYGEVHDEIARILIDRGASLEALDSLGRTPLQAAVYRILTDAFRPDRLDETHRKFLTVLLEAGADPNSRDREGRTVLHHLVFSRFYGLALAMVDYGANGDIADKHGKTVTQTLAEQAMRRGVTLSTAQQTQLEELRSRLQVRAAL